MRQLETKQTSPPPRRWLQYGLRSLLVLTLAVAIFMGWWTQYRRPYLRQKDAIEQLVKLGATVETKPKGPMWLAWLVGDSYVDVDSIMFMDFRGGPSVDFDHVRSSNLKCLADLQQVRLLDLSSCPELDDGVCDAIVKIGRIKSLSLERTQVTPAGLARLRTVAGMRQLSLRNCKAIDDNACEILPQFPDLEILDLALTSVSDDGLAALTRMPKLTSLDISWAKISPKSTAILAGCRRLENLEIDWKEESPGPIEFRNYPVLNRLTIGPWGRNYPKGTKRNIFSRLIVEDMPSLERLDIYEAIDQTAVRRIARLRDCYFVDLGQDTELADLPILERFHSSSPRVGLQGRELSMRQIGPLKHLWASDVRFMDFPAKSFEWLEELTLSDCEFPSGPAAALVNLKSLDLRGRNKPTGLVAALLQSPNLKSLRLDHVPGVGADFGSYQNLVNVEFCDLDLRDGELACLERMPKLESLELRRATSLTTESLKHLASLSALRKLSLDQPHWDDAAVPYLLNLPALIHVETGNTQFSAESKLQLRQLRARLPSQAVP